MWFSKLWITSFWLQILHLNFKENVEKMEGKIIPSNMAANTNNKLLLAWLKNQSAIKYLP